MRKIDFSSFSCRYRQEIVYLHPKSVLKLADRGEDEYPEFTMFGELPAWGFYLRHVRNITLKNVQLSLADDDFRPAIVEEDVENMLLLLDR